MIIAKQTTNHRSRRRYVSFLFNFVVAGAWFLGNMSVVHADIPDRLRLMTAIKKFEGTELVAVAYEKRAPSWMRANRVELSLGALTQSGHTRPFFAIGPVWRFERPTTNWFFEFSFSPTVLTNPRLAKKTLGGHIHFTSALSVGRDFANGWTLALRTQHISNGGLHNRNPGLDSIGFTVAKQSSR